VSAARQPRLLLVLEGDARPGAELPRSGMLVIGSSRERAGFVVEGEGVADVHCAVGRTKGGGWAAKDLGSPQGTHVNGQAIDSVRLSAGDRISIGSRTLRVVDPAEPASDPQPAAAAAPAAEPRAARAAAGPVSAESSAAVESSATLDPGTTGKRAAAPRAEALPAVAGYRIERQLGRGGMGTVYLALQESLQRQVALKVLATKLEADREFVRRFQAEARAAAALNHPNVVTVYDVGEEGGTHYLSMEYMDRGNLEERLAKGPPIGWREALAMLRDAASGLVYAESRKIVHRDLKPANLMQNHTGVTKIADLGLATHVEAEEAEAADRKVFGTPHFMSPEQARGERVDSRSDLYSLGATAYRLLTGHTPFEGATSRDILRAHLREEPRPMTEFVSDLPPDIIACVTKLMQKDPAQRFASAADLLREIDRLRGDSRAGRSPSSPTPARSRRGLLAVLALVLIGGAGAVYWLAPQTGNGSGGKHASANGAGAHDPSALAADHAGRGTEGGSSAASTADGSVDPETSAEPREKVDDDKALQLFEANARVAFLELSSREMEAAAKRDELRALAGRFRGTTAATEALEKADAIEVELQRALLETSARASALESVITRLRAAAALEAKPPRPGDALEKMSAVDGQQAFAQDPAFQSAKKSIELAVIQNACAYARDVLADTQRDLEAGRFEAVQPKLTDLVKAFELPDFPAGQAPPGIDEYFELGRSARERLKNLELLRGHYAEKQSQETALQIANAFGGPTGLEHELRQLDLAAARARLSALAAKLPPGPPQSFVQGLLADCEHGAAALAMLGREYSSGGWHRKNFIDPRDRKNPARTAVGVDANGILCEGEGGQVENVPWSAFGGSAKELSNLFWERTTRDYTPAEVRGITGLIRLTAVIEALERTAKMFDRTRHANFTDGNARDLAECFVPLQQWIQKLGGEASLARESQAAALLAQVLAQTTEGTWSVAVAGTERLLDEYQDTLLVRLLSDGSATDPARTAQAAGALPAQPAAPKAKD
jgi:tRNA A-37 threonylcarbamoyl transferase component Bud32